MSVARKQGDYLATMSRKYPLLPHMCGSERDHMWCDKTSFNSTLTSKNLFCSGHKGVISGRQYSLTEETRAWESG